MKKINLVGNKYDRLIVLRETNKRTRQGSIIWECVCDCGNTVFSTGGNLKRYNTKSCGCLNRQKRAVSCLKHGMTNTPEFKCWQHIISRCTKPFDRSYKNYGGRGISICERWFFSFQNFFEDMGNRPSNNHSIERNNVNGNYEPSNCRWATRDEQAKNKRNTRRVEYQGEFYHVNELCKKIGISKVTLYNKLRDKKEIGKTHNGVIILNTLTGIYYDTFREAAKSASMVIKTLMYQLNEAKVNKTPFLRA